VLLCCSASFVVLLGGAGTSVACGPVPADDRVLAGAAKADITPQGPVYLGGYGLGPVRRSTGTLQPLYVRALALRSLDGAPAHTLVLAVLDSQGYFAAYQAGSYGLSDIRGTVSAQLGIPTAQIVIASTHSHAAPDTVGFWGGVPASYLDLVRERTIVAITQAVPNLTPATLSVGTSDLTGATASFGEAGHGGQGSGAPWPVDTQCAPCASLTPVVTRSPPSSTRACIQRLLARRTASPPPIGPASPPRASSRRSAAPR
jgi:hypothetical protein